MKAKIRASKELVKARANELVRIMLDGAMNLDVEEYVREKEREPGSLWFVGEDGQPIHYATIRRYVERAEKIIASECRLDREKSLRRHFVQRRRLYAAAVNQGDVRAALAVLQDEATLLGLYPARKTEHTGKDGEALYPSLHKMVVAVIQAEASQTNGERRHNGECTHAPLAVFPANDPGNPAGDAAALIGSEALP